MHNTLKGDIDFRYHYYTNKTDQLVFRAFLGVGYPYGNSQAMPFEKQYFSGGLTVFVPGMSESLALVHMIRVMLLSTIKLLI